MSQFTLLFLNAWRRFARADGLARDSDPRAALWLAAIAFGTPGLFVAFYLSFPIPVAGHWRMIDPWPSLNLLALYSGLLVALATLLQWESLLPGAADATVMAPLPVPPRRLVAAHGAALAALLALLTFVANAPAVVAFSVLCAPPDADMGFMLGMAWRQIAAVIVTAGLAFFPLLALQSLLVCCTGPRGLRTIGGALQLGGLVVVLAALLFAPGLLVAGARWHWLLASPLPLARWAAALAAAAALLYVPAARRALRPVARRRAGRSPRLPARFWGRAPRIAAVTRFAALTLARCRRQRLIVGAWLAVGAAIVLESALDLAGPRTQVSASDVAREGLAVPLVLALFLLAGLRHSFTVPSEVRANWIFRLCAGDRRGDLLLGGRRILAASFALALLPGLGLAALFWPHAALAGQIAFLLLAGALWVQCLTCTLRKIPFTCSYQPGGVNLKYIWPLYVLGFVLGGYSLAGWEQWLLARPWRLLPGLSSMAAVLVYSERARRRAWRELEYVFDDDPLPVVQSLFTN